MSAASSLRIDKLLWYLRLTKTRTLAQRVVTDGHVRRNGARILRTHEPVAVGDVLVVPLGSGMKVIEIVSLPLRRGPATEAQACYRALDVAPGFAIAAAPTCAGKEGPRP